LQFHHGTKFADLHPLDLENITFLVGKLRDLNLHINGTHPLKRQPHEKKVIIYEASTRTAARCEHFVISPSIPVNLCDYSFCA
jgi:hypothetical protein